MAFRTKKISQMDPKGSNLASTDLLEISELVSGSYVTKSITGAEIISGATTGYVPTTRTISTTAPLSGGGDLSANRTLSIATANTTTTGALSSTDWNTFNAKQATISLTTTGTGAATFVSNVLNVPTPASATFNSLTTTGTSGASTLTAGVLNVPTYSLAGLGGVPTTRTLTINGTTQDLSADRTFTISTGITIGTTAITSGTVGRVLFEGTGNVVQESANLFWDNTNGRLGIGTSSPSQDISVSRTIDGITSISLLNASTGTTASSRFYLGTTNTQVGKLGSNYTAGSILKSGDLFMYNQTVGNITFWNNLSTGNINFTTGSATTAQMTIASTGNVLINTTTDNGYKLDVNGNAQITGNLIFPAGERLIQYGASSFFVGRDGAGVYLAYNFGSQQIDIGSVSTGNIRLRTTANVILDQATSKLLIGTSTDAGYKLDVNGSARVSGALTLATGTAVASSISYGATYGVTIYGNTGSNSDLTLTDRGGNLRFRIVNGGNILQTSSVINDISIGTGGVVKSIVADGTYGMTVRGGVGSIYNLSLVENTGNNGLFIDSSGNAKVGIYNSTYNSSAILEAVSTTKGFLPPRMTTTQKNAIATPATGLQIYDSTLNRPCFYDGTSWITL